MSHGMNYESLFRKHSFHNNRTWALFPLYSYTLLNHMLHPSQQIHFSVLSAYVAPHLGQVASSLEESESHSASSSISLDSCIAARTSSIGVEALC